MPPPLFKEKIMAETNVIDKVKKETSQTPKKPRKYAVIFINDDYTPFDFVISLLMEVFRKTMHEAEVVAKAVHETGKGVAGVYTHEIAETKLAQANRIIKTTEHPLVLVMEPEE